MAAPLKISLGSYARILLLQKLELNHFAEMDTVHSSQESKRVILTFFLTREKLFPAFIMNRCTKGAVRLIFDKLEHQLGTYDFLTLFNTILTDQGSEFGDPDSLETGTDGIIRSSIYFCDPMRSGQKGGIEQAHTMLRMVLPKKTSFEFLTQWDLRTIVDHINSTPREILGGRTPYDVALEFKISSQRTKTSTSHFKLAIPNFVTASCKILNFRNFCP